HSFDLGPRFLVPLHAYASHASLVYPFWRHRKTIQRFRLPVRDRRLSLYLVAPNRLAFCGLFIILIFRRWFLLLPVSVWFGGCQASSHHSPVGSAILVQRLDGLLSAVFAGKGSTESPGATSHVPVV